MKLSNDIDDYFSNYDNSRVYILHVNGTIYIYNETQAIHVYCITIYMYKIPNDMATTKFYENEYEC